MRAAIEAVDAGHPIRDAHCLWRFQLHIRGAARRCNRLLVKANAWRPIDPFPAAGLCGRFSDERLHCAKSSAIFSEGFTCAFRIGWLVGTGTAGARIAGPGMPV